jgi:ADP-heptose:LPS heptosyltransferase
MALKTIDLVMFRTIGDVLCVTPIVHAIRLKYPDAIIRFHTGEKYAPLLKGNKEINQIIAYKAPEDGRHSSHTLDGCYMDVYRFLEDNPTDHLCPMAMANNMDTAWHHRKETQNDHFIDYYARRADIGLSIPLLDKHIHMYHTAEEEHQAKEILAKLDGKKYVAMHTTAGWNSKDWPIESFNELAIRLRRTYGVGIVQVGGPKDKQVNSADVKVLGMAPGVCRTVLSRASLFIGLDSGLLYVAESCNTPSIAIMGATSATPGDSSCGPLMGPVAKNITYIEPDRPKLPSCWPVACVSTCVLKTRCIDSISLDRVMSVIKNRKDLSLK